MICVCVVYNREECTDVHAVAEGQHISTFSVHRVKGYAHTHTNIFCSIVIVCVFSAGQKEHDLKLTRSSVSSRYAAVIFLQLLQSEILHNILYVYIHVCVILYAVH